MLNFPTLNRLRQTEAGSEIDEKGGSAEGRDESGEAALANLAPRLEGKDSCEDDKQANGEDLICDTGQEDVIDCRGILTVGLLNADERRSSNFGKWWGWCPRQ